MNFTISFGLLLGIFFEIIVGRSKYSVLFSQSYYIDRIDKTFAYFAPNNNGTY